jgi:hypothetical protein
MDNVQKHSSCIYTCLSLTGFVYVDRESTPSGIQLLPDWLVSYVSATALQRSVQTQRSDFIQLIS